MVKEILRIVPLAQSVKLASKNLKFKKKNKVDDFISSGFEDIVGVGLIGETANIIESY